MADPSADPRQVARHFVRSVGRKNASQPTPRELGTQWVRQKDGNDAYGDSTGQSYMLDAEHNHAWKKGSIEIDAEKALAHKKKQELARKKAEEEREARELAAKAAPPPETPEEKQKKLSMEINTRLRAEKQSGKQPLGQRSGGTGQQSITPPTYQETPYEAPKPKSSGAPTSGGKFSIKDITQYSDRMLKFFEALDKSRKIIRQPPKFLLQRRMSKRSSRPATGWDRSWSRMRMGR